jgi:hypothetical protein
MRQSGPAGWQTAGDQRKRLVRCPETDRRNKLRIYPVYTVYRNKFPRPPGQGASLIERLATGISGSQTGGQGVLDVSLPELVTQGGSFGQWPLNLPPAGSQTFVTLNIPSTWAA